MSRLLFALLCAAPTLAMGDAAVKAQEGEIKHWIEHYQRERQVQQGARATGEQPRNAHTQGPVPAEQGQGTKR